MNFTGRIIIVGGTGFVGQMVTSTLRRALPQNVQISAISRRPPVEKIECVDYFRTDIHASNDFLSLIDSVDSVIWIAANRDHFASYSIVEKTNVAPINAAITHLATIMRKPKFIYLSSLSAVDGWNYRSGPITDVSIACPTTPYGRSKLAAETLLRRSTLDTAILRLPFLYGPNYSKMAFLAWCRDVVMGHIQRYLRLPGRLSLLHTSDLADIILQLLVNQSHNEMNQSNIWTISDGLIYPIDFILGEVAVIFERPLPPRRIFLPEATAKAFGLGAMRYWRHAAFKSDFVCDPVNFHTAFPRQYISIRHGLKSAYGVMQNAMPTADE